MADRERKLNDPAVLEVLSKLTITAAILVIPIAVLLFGEFGVFRGRLVQSLLTPCVAAGIFLSTVGGLYMLIATRRPVWILAILPGIAVSALWVLVLQGVSAYKR